MRIKPILIILFFSIGMTAQAQDLFLKDKAAVQEFSKETMNLFADYEVTAAFKAFYLYWPMQKNELESLESKTLSSLNLIQPTFGRILGYKKLQEFEIDDYYYREVYLLRYENSALRFVFTFYKNDNGWIVNSFKWDSVMDDEFVEIKK